MLTINDLTDSGSNPVEAIQTAVAGGEADLEVWLTRHDESVLCALINATHAFLMWMRPDCPEGWHSAGNQASSLEATGEMSFILANGQEDHFPSECCILRGQVTDAFLEFWAHGQRPSLVNWTQA